MKVKKKVKQKPFSKRKRRTFVQNTVKHLKSIVTQTTV